MQTVLFLCSGNYYRSRFAESLFNWLAPQQMLDWRAESKGFRLHPANIGPISHHAVSGLRLRGLPIPEPDRFPLVANANDIEAADLVIAVKEAEHRPMMLKRFPAWANRIEYWQIHDLDGAEPDVALVELEEQVRALIERLRTWRCG
jgi:protein-tyrosine phosphatase